MLLPTVLPMSAYAGTPRAFGEAYGEEHREGIRIGVETGAPRRPSQWQYIADCMKAPWRFRREIDALTHGIARASGKTYLEIGQFYAHEELVRMKHCTAIGATGKGTHSGQPIIGMNWDAAQETYPWARLLRLKCSAWPEMLLYSPYPGLWCGAGMNAHGLSLVWTGANHLIRRRCKWPVVGVPTYALIAGVLACRTSADVRALLEATHNAGGFIFFVADAQGDVMVVEAVPGRRVFVPCRDVLTRANHLEDPVLVRQSGQVVPRSTPMQNSGARGRRVHQLAKARNGRLDASTVQGILRDEHGAAGLTICQSCAKGNPYMTVDSFYCLPARREFWIARGLPSRHRYERVTVSA